MTEDNKRKIVLPKGGVFNDLSVRIKLIIRLITDPRISPLLKLLPFGSLLYFIIPDLAIGPIDDVAVVWLGAYLFVELCPPDVVREHMDALQNRPLSDGSENSEEPGGEVIDGEFWEKQDRE